MVEVVITGTVVLYTVLFPRLTGHYWRCKYSSVPTVDITGTIFSSVPTVEVVIISTVDTVVFPRRK